MSKKTPKKLKNEPQHQSKQGKFHIEFKNTPQKLAWAGFQQHDILFLSGPAGCGKTYLAMAFAINEVLDGRKKRIILTRPIVEAGESLGYLPGTFEEKTGPYMMPLIDAMKKLLGNNIPQWEKVQAAVEVAPLAYLRGRSFDNAVCILDEAQNTTMMQLKLFLTRFNEGSKIIVTGDPSQSDLGPGHVALTDVIHRLENIPGIGVITFKADSIVRHPLVGKIIERLE